MKYDLVGFELFLPSYLSVDLVYILILGVKEVDIVDESGCGFLGLVDVEVVVKVFVVFFILWAADLILFLCREQKRDLVMVKLFQFWVGIVFAYD